MSLVSFGFTKTQEAVYRALLHTGPATGYQVARHVRLARANVYQALDVLAARGLAATSGGRPAVYRAKGLPEVIAHLRGCVERDLESLASEFGVAPLTRPGRDDAADPHRLTSRAGLLEAAVGAVDAARHEVLAVVGPWAGDVPAALQRAGARGVSCRVVSLGDPAPAGAVLRATPVAELRPYWGGMPILLVCDRTRAVGGVISDEAADGIDTRGPGLVPFLRHLLRREIASAGGPHRS